MYKIYDKESFELIGETKRLNEAADFLGASRQNLYQNKKVDKVYVCKGHYIIDSVAPYARAFIKLKKIERLLYNQERRYKVAFELEEAWKRIETNLF